MQIKNRNRFLQKRYQTQLTSNVVYGYGSVGYSGPQPRTRPLRLDVYEPIDETTGEGITERPALILAFGGAFHRGSKEDDSVNEAGHANTTIAKYCELFAQRGYVTFSIEYRLVPEDPDPGTTPVVGRKESIPRSRVDRVREMLGLPPATTEMLWCGIEAASDDFSAAFDFVAANASRWGISRDSIAVGGFSAGARSALNAVYAENRQASAIISLSGYMDPEDLAQHIEAGRRTPVLFTVGENDLDYVRASGPPLARQLEAASIPCEMYSIKGATHFYSASSQVTSGEKTEVLEDAIAAFLYRNLHLDKANFT
jgi:acetyl esterase/lipase